MTVKNCTTCYVKQIKPSCRCTIMNVEFWDTDECFAWVKDRLELKRRSDACKDYQMTVNEATMRYTYYCGHCKQPFLDTKQATHFCPHCGRKHISKRGGEDDEE